MVSMVAHLVEATQGLEFSKLLERTRWLEICRKLPWRTRWLEFYKVPRARSVARILQELPERTQRLELCKSSQNVSSGSKFAKFPERSRRLAICKVPARWFGFCKVPGAHAGARILQSEIPSPSEVPSISPFPHSPTHPPIHATACIQSLWRACGRMAAPDGINKRHSPLARPYSTRKPRCGQTPETLSTQ